MKIWTRNRKKIPRERIKSDKVGEKYHDSARRNQREKNKEEKVKGRHSECTAQGFVFANPLTRSTANAGGEHY